MNIPNLGFGAVDLLRPKYLLGFDTETYAMPEIEGFTVRKPGRLVCSTWAGRDNIPPALQELPRENCLIFQTDTEWTSIVDRPASRVAIPHLIVPENLVVAHNAPYDLSVSAELIRTEAFWAQLWRTLLAGGVADTAVREKLLSIAFDTTKYDPILNQRPKRFSLSACLARRFGIDISDSKSNPDAWRLRYHELDGVPLKDWPKDAVEYAISDARYALWVAADQAPINSPIFTDGDDPGMVTTRTGGVIDEVRQTPADFALFLGSCHSVVSDEKDTLEWEADVEAEVERLIADAQRLGFMRANGTKDMAAMRALVSRDLIDQGIEPPLTPKGAISTAKDVLALCDNPVLRAFGEEGSVFKHKSTYLAPLKIGNKYILPINYDVLKDTGRTSSFNTNIQNPPRGGKYRKCIKARAARRIGRKHLKQKVLCSTDYTAAESVGLAQIHYWTFGKSALRDAINNDVDTHKLLGAQLAGVSFEEFLTWWDSGDPEKVKLAQDVFRQGAKVGNFGIPGGLGAATFVKYARDGYGVDLAETYYLIHGSNEGMTRREAAETMARQIIEKWGQTFPEGPEYMRIIGDLCKRGAFTYQQWVSLRHRGGCGYCDGNNTGFQGIVADGAKNALVRLAVAMYAPPSESPAILREFFTWEDDSNLEAECRYLYGVRCPLFIHDETITEGDEDTAHLWGPAVAHFMREGLRVFTPDVKVSAEPALMRRWYKSAKTVYDDQGRLTVWEPK